MTTTWCLAVAFLSPWVVGAPVYWLARGCRALRPNDWLWVPFVGLAAVVCPLQTVTVLADLPLARSVPWYWCALGALWVGFVARPTGRASLRAVPVRVVFLAAVAYLALGGGLLRQGVEEYRGKLHSDQYNYVVIAQSITDLPFSTAWADVGQRPWLALACSLKADRLGQSVAHGFFAVTAGREALDLFFPTLFLTGALVVPAARALAPHFGLFGRRADLASVVVALVPGVMTLVAECYLSHALFIPILIAYTAAAIRATRRRAVLPLAGVLFVLGFAVYTEFGPLMFGAGGAAALGALAAGRISVTRAALVVVAPVAAVVLNPAAVVAARMVALRAVEHAGIINPAHTLWMMLQNVWIDVLFVTGTKPVLGVLPKGVFVVLCYCLAGLGWVRCLAAPGVRRRAAALAAVASLMLLPAVVVAVSPDSRYVVYKLLFTASPLYALGLCLAVRGGWAGGSVAARVRLAAVAVAVFALVADTVRFQKSTHRRQENQIAATWNDPDVRRIADRLNAEPPGKVVIALGDDEFTWVASGALLYHARRHRIQVASPRQVWLYPCAQFGGAEVEASGHPAPGTLVVTRPGAGTPVAGEVLVRTNGYLLVRTGGVSPREQARAARP